MDKHYTFQTQGVCAQEISFDIIDGHVFNVKFKGGCRGNTQGVAVVSLKKKALVTGAVRLDTSGIVNQSRYRSRTVPTAGAVLKEEDSPEKQISFEV